MVSCALFFCTGIAGTASVTSTGTKMHIGKEIRHKLEEQGHTVVWFARQLSCSRSNVYLLFEKSSLDTNVLLRVSIILKHNFFESYSEEYEIKARK